MGLGTARFLVAETREQHEEDFAAAMWQVVVKAYEESMGFNGCPYAGMPAETVALENARLVWMQDEPGKLWTPPGYPEEYLEGGWDE